MTHTETLLLVNSMLLALTGILLGVIGFFLKDLHRKFSVLVDKVNGLATDQSTGSTEGRVYRVMQEKALARLSDRIDRLESETYRTKIQN